MLKRLKLQYISCFDFLKSHIQILISFSCDLLVEGINSGSHTYFFDHTRILRASRRSDQLNAGATSVTTQTWKTIHTIHAPIHSNKANNKGWLWRPNDIRGPCERKASWHLSYRWGKTAEKTFTQETCPDRWLNPCPLNDRRACYRLFLSDIQILILKIKN